MSKEDANIDLIELYLAGRSSKKEKEEVEERMQNDPKFKALFEEVRKVIKGVEYSARNELLNKLRETEKGLPEIVLEKKPRIVRIKRIKYAIAIAATIALLIGSVYTILISRDDGSREDYLTNYYAPYPNIIHPVQRAEDTLMTDEELAYYYYESEQYEKALELFLAFQEDSVNLESTLFYLANIYMALGKYEDAIEKFNNLLNDSVVFENQTRWYLSLCYLEDGNYDSAQQQLEQITKTENSYNERAVELMDKIKKK
jgi:tetratricopeptide (TPR) repeat protein